VAVKAFFPESASYEDVRRGIDSFCQPPENASIPVPYGLLVFTQRTNGGSAANIEEMTATYRARAAADAAK
jgi:hypothetical protein